MIEEEYFKLLRTMTVLDIRRTFIIPAIQQIILNYEKESLLQGNSPEAKRAAREKKDYWEAICQLVIAAK